MEKVIWRRRFQDLVHNRSDISQVTSCFGCVLVLNFLFLFFALVVILIFIIQTQQGSWNGIWKYLKSKCHSFMKRINMFNEQHLYKLGVTLCILWSIVFLMKSCLLWEWQCECWIKGQWSKRALKPYHDGMQYLDLPLKKYFSPNKRCSISPKL